MINKILVAIAVIAVGGAAFYGGMKYGENRVSSGRGLAPFQNLSPEERQQAFQQFRSGGFSGGRRTGGGGDFVSGEIISKDEQSVTVKLRDGGSKIIFLSGSTSIGKTTEGAPSDLGVGKQIMVNGKTNDDGSITAESIQIRPRLPVQDQAAPQ